MISVTSREFHYLCVDPGSYPEVITWKKASRHETHTFPEETYQKTIDFLLGYCKGFDFLTVPAPSFHDYAENYPIYEVAKLVSNDIGLPLRILFPNRSGKTKMGWHSSIEKCVQKIDCEPGKFVLVLDDIATTRNTFRVTSRSIMDCGSFACCVAISGNIYGRI